MKPTRRQRLPWFRSAVPLCSPWRSPHDIAVTTEASRALPIADSESGLSILKELLRDRSLLTALTLMYRYVGKAFRITLPRFQPAVFIGPESNRQILVTDRHKLRWRRFWPRSRPRCWALPLPSGSRSWWWKAGPCFSAC